MPDPIKNNTPEERLTYQLCIETINKIAKEYGDLYVPSILDPLIAERIDSAIQDVLTKLEDLNSNTDIKIEDINKIKEDCQKIIANGNELSANFLEAFGLLESIVAHVDDIESSTGQKAQEIQSIKEAIEILEANIKSLVDRAELIENNIDNLYREFVEKYNHSVQIYNSVREWKEQIEKNILLSKSTLEELKILFPHAQEIKRKLEEAIAIGFELEQEIRNAKNIIIETGQEQVNNMNIIKNGFDTLATDKTNEFTILAEEKTKSLTDLATDKANEFTTLAKEKIETFLNLIHPINSTYTQYPDETTGSFDETETPRSLFGGDWEQLFTDKGIFFRTEGGLSAENRDASTGIQLDAMQILTGKLKTRTTNAGSFYLGVEGIFTSSASSLRSGCVQEGNVRESIDTNFDNSRQARTSTENRSINMLMKIWKRIG